MTALISTRSTISPASLAFRAATARDVSVAAMLISFSVTMIDVRRNLAKISIMKMIGGGEEAQKSPESTTTLMTITTRMITVTMGIIMMIIITLATERREEGKRDPSKKIPMGQSNLTIAFRPIKRSEIWTSKMCFATRKLSVKDTAKPRTTER